MRRTGACGFPAAWGEEPAGRGQNDQNDTCEIINIGKWKTEGSLAWKFS